MFQNLEIHPKFKSIYFNALTPIIKQVPNYLTHQSHIYALYIRVLTKKSRSLELAPVVFTFVWRRCASQYAKPCKMEIPEFIRIMQGQVLSEYYFSCSLNLDAIFYLLFGVRSVAVTVLDTGGRICTLKNIHTNVFDELNYYLDFSVP